MMHDVKLQFCFRGTVLINSEPVRSPVFMTKIVQMPCCPFPGMQLWLNETQAMADTAGWGNAPIKFVTWHEDDPETVTAYFEERGDDVHDYLNTRWLINELKMAGWRCEEDEGD